jgi:hypothetical protein
MGDLNAHTVLVENLEGKKLLEDTGLNTMT